MRFTGYVPGEYLRIQYEIKHREVPATLVADLVPINDRVDPDEWFTVRVQMDNHDDIHVKPEEVVLWLPHYVLHVMPTGEAFAYVPDGRMLNVVTAAMLP